MQMWFVCKTIQMWFVWLQECLEASFPKAYVRHALKCIKTEAIDSSVHKTANHKAARWASNNSKNECYDCKVSIQDCLR